MPYEMRGRFLESCDCNVPCPCWFERDPDDAECTGLVGWYIEKGEIDGVDVSGLVTVSLSHHGGHRKGAKMRIATYVDDRASDEQHDKLVQAFTGRLGGPLGELADMVGDVAAEERVPVTYTDDGAFTNVDAGGLAESEMRPMVGPTGRIITLADGQLSNLLGTPGEFGTARLRLDVGDDAFDRDLQDRSGTRGRFAYRHGAS